MGEEQKGKPEGDATGGIIPYKNPAALAGYYCAVFSLIPFLGLPLGMAAFVLGIFGLKKRKDNPETSGLLHSLVALIGGGFTTLLWGGLVVLFIVGAMSKGR